MQTCPNVTIMNSNESISMPNPECDRSSETAYFWYRTTVDTSESIGVFGGINWRMLLCLISAWILVYACICKGIKTSGKVHELQSNFERICFYFLGDVCNCYFTLYNYDDILDSSTAVARSPSWHPVHAYTKCKYRD